MLIKLHIGELTPHYDLGIFPRFVLGVLLSYSSVCTSYSIYSGFIR